jgi:hypothetical protein
VEGKIARFAIGKMYGCLTTTGILPPLSEVGGGLESQNNEVGIKFKG